MSAGAQPERLRRDPLETLARLVRDPPVSVSRELDEALEALDMEMTRLAGALQIEYLGPGVGMADMNAEHVYRVVVRHHVWDTTTAGWGVRVCDALDNNDLRPMWSLRGVGRLRKRQLLAVLPEFFQGYAAALEAAGVADTPAGRRVLEIARALA